MPHQKLKRRFSLERYGISPAAETTILAAFVGVFTGFGVIFFKNTIRFVQWGFWHLPSMNPQALLELPWWMRLLIPAVGGLIVGPLIYFLAREAEGNGVPEVMEAVVIKNGIIRPVVVMIKIVASALSIGSGGSVGREGPIVQIGAAIGSSIGQFLKLRQVQMKTIVGCGVAAGISATFNAPIAGSLFALELIVSDFGLTSFIPIIVAAVTSTAITRHFYGNVLEFVLPHFQMVSFWELFIYLFLGLLAGIVGSAFSRFLYIAGDGFKALKLPPWLKPAIGGLVVGAIAIKLPHIMGVGYETIHVMFGGELTLWLMILLVFLKIFTTSVTVGSGGSGGVFSPSLFIGAMLGGAFGTVIHGIFPEMTGSPGAYAIVGMGAVNGACTLAPLSAIIVLIELTNNYSITLPLMFTVGIATLVSRKFSHDSIYTRKLSRKGIQVHMGEDLNILRALKVSDIIRHDESTVSSTASMEELLNLALNKHRNIIFVVDSDGRFQGMITLQELKQVMMHPEKHKHATVSDLVEQYDSIYVDQTLDTVINVFGDTGYERLPVIDRTGKLVGSAILSDLIRQYNMEVANRNVAIELGAVVHTKEQSGMLHLGGDTIVTEFPVPEWVVGKSIGDIGLRKNYHISVFLVKENTGEQEPRIVTPGSSYIFRGGDTMLAGGKQEYINSFIKQSPKT